METSPIPNSTSGDAVTGSGSSRSIVSMMIGVFTSPAQTFTDFAKRPSILLPLFTVMVLAAGAGLMAVVGIAFFKESAHWTRHVGIGFAIAGLYLMQHAPAN